MDGKKLADYTHRFAVFFGLLFIILIVLPLIIDNLFHFLGEGILPGKDSIRVFKDAAEEYATIVRFTEILKKLINYM